MGAQTPTIPEGPLVGGGEFSPLFDAVRLIVSFLQWRFSELPQGSYRYVAEDSPEEKSSEIFIGADTPIRVETVGARPAITVMRSQASAAGLSLGDLSFQYLHTGGKVRADMLPTNILINCLSSEQVEAEGIAWFAFREIFALRQEIIKKSNGLFLSFGQRAMISPPSPAGSLVDSTEVEWTAVVLSFPCYLQFATTTLPLNKRILNGIDINATTQRQTSIVEPIVPLQGTAVQQPEQTNADRGAASAPDLPQMAQNEAQSSEPLTVKIQTR